MEKQKNRRPRRLTPDIKDQTTILYEGDEGKVVVPHTIKSSQYWGNATRWCISGTKEAHHHFPNYNERSAPLIMLIPNKDGLPEERNGKITIMNGEVWDETDNLDNGEQPKYELPAHVTALCNAALAQGDKGKAAYFKIFKERIVPEKVVVQKTKTIADRFPDLSPEQQGFLEHLNDIREDYLGRKYFFEDHPECASDVKFMTCCVQIKGDNLRYANHDVLKNDLESYRKLILEAAWYSKDADFLTSIDNDALASDPAYSYSHFALDLMGYNQTSFYYLNKTILAEEPKFYKELFYYQVRHNNGLDLAFINEDERKGDSPVLTPQHKFFLDDMKFYVSLCTAAVKKDGWALLHVDADTIIEKKGMDTYCDIVEAAAREDGRALEKARLDDIAEHSLERYFDIFEAAAHSNPDHDYLAFLVEPLTYMDSDILITHDPERYRKSCLSILQKNEIMIKDVHPDLKADLDFMADAICANVGIFNHLEEQEKENLDSIECLLHKAQNSTEPQKTLNVLEIIHRIPLFFGHVTADFDELLEHVKSAKTQKQEYQNFLKKALYSSLDAE